MRTFLPVVTSLGLSLFSVDSFIVIANIFLTSTYTTGDKEITFEEQFGKTSQ